MSTLLLNRSAALTEEEFLTVLRQIGEQMAADGMPVIKQLLLKADEGLAACRIENWPERLQVEAYAKVGVEAPVRMYPVRATLDSRRE